MFRSTCLTVFLVISLCGAATAEEGRGRVGTVKNVSGEAHIVRDGRQIPAIAGAELLQGDRLLTGSSGRMGVLLEDDTSLSLGPGTESTIAEFLFNPGEGKYRMVLRVTRGIFGYLSGKIAKLAPGAARVETPVATLGVRGTYFVARILP